MSVTREPYIAIDPKQRERVRLGMQKLTARESGVLALALTGISAKEIAEQVGIEHESVHRVIQFIRRRLGVNSMTQAAVYIATIEAEQRRRRAGIMTHV